MTARVGRLESRVVRSVLLIAATLLVLSAPAEARKPHRMTFQFATVVAVDYWAKRDIAVACHPQARVFTAAEDSDLQLAYAADGFASVAMLAYVETCTIGITPGADGLRNDRDLAWMYCMEVVHEIGHIAGLGHDYGGVMALGENVVPWGCDHPLKFRRHRRR